MPESLYSIYVVVREDLEQGKAMAQAAHAVAGLVNQCHIDCWYRKESSTKDRILVNKTVEYGRMIVLGGVYSEYELAMFSSPMLMRFSSTKDMPRIFAYTEPDLNHQMTAIAWLVSGNEQLLFSSLPLAFKPKPTKRKWWQRGN